MAQEIRDEEIHLLIDGELTPEQTADLQARLGSSPGRAAEVFAEATRMATLRASQPSRLFPKNESLMAATRLERRFRQRRFYSFAQTSIAAALVFAAGWGANAFLIPKVYPSSEGSFVLEAREAVRVAQLEAGPEETLQQKQAKIERLEGAINISVPSLPLNWQVTDVQIHPWDNTQGLVIVAVTPELGPVTLVAAPMSKETAVPLTLASDGRFPTYYWQSGGTAYALMGPASAERLEAEAKDIEVATRSNL